MARGHTCPDCLECLVRRVRFKLGWYFSHMSQGGKFQPALSSERRFLLEVLKVNYSYHLHNVFKALFRVKKHVVLLEALKRISAKPMMVITLGLGSRVRSALLSRAFYLRCAVPTNRSFFPSHRHLFSLLAVTIDGAALRVRRCSRPFSRPNAGGIQRDGSPPTTSSAAIPCCRRRIPALLQLPGHPK